MHYVCNVQVICNYHTSRQWGVMRMGNGPGWVTLIFFFIPSIYCLPQKYQYCPPPTPGGNGLLHLHPSLFPRGHVRPDLDPNLWYSWKKIETRSVKAMWQMPPLGKGLACNTFVKSYLTICWTDHFYYFSQTEARIWCNIYTANQRCIHTNFGNINMR